MSPVMRAILSLSYRQSLCQIWHSIPSFRYCHSHRSLPHFVTDIQTSKFRHILEACILSNKLIVTVLIFHSSPLIVESWSLLTTRCFILPPTFWRTFTSGWASSLHIVVIVFALIFGIVCCRRWRFTIRLPLANVKNTFHLIVPNFVATNAFNVPQRLLI